MYFLCLSFILEEDPTFLYFDFIFIKRVSDHILVWQILFPNIHLQLYAGTSAEHIYSLAIFPPTWRLYKCKEQH